MSKPLQGTVNLPGSKSESNRALMIAAYGGFPLEVDGLSDAHDTVLLKKLLEQVNDNDVVVDCEDAGTVARFLLTYLANKSGTWFLTGSERLSQRPMAPLIDALRQLGADIDGDALPLKIIGKPLKGGPVTLDASQSSQFASSLLLAAPIWECGLQLTLTGSLVSMPYLEMTLSIMEHFGVHAARVGNVITVARQSYRNCPFTVSSDWSAASYWYEMMALSDGGSLLLKGLHRDTLQGDSRVADLFKSLGVNTEYVADDVRISSTGTPCCFEKPLLFDFSDTPDLFPSVFVTCVALHIDAVFNNIITLYDKESDRVNSLIFELSKVYTFINIVSENTIIIEKSSFIDNQSYEKKISFNTYKDHRLAMALAGLSFVFSNIDIDDYDIVKKSYPTFWDDFFKVCPI